MNNSRTCSGATILPCSWAVRRRWVVSGWDRFVIPKPFNRGIFIWGEPIRIASDAGEQEAERVRLQIEAALTDLTAQADSAMGLEPFESGPARHSPAPSREAVP